MNTIDEAIAILQAMEDGKTIQFRHPQTAEEWTDRVHHKTGFPEFNVYEYRIKPAPVKRLIRVEELPDECWITSPGSSDVIKVLGFDAESQMIRLCDGWYRINGQTRLLWSPSRKGPWSSFETQEEAK